MYVCSCELVTLVCLQSCIVCVFVSACFVYSMKVQYVYRGVGVLS